MKLKDDILEKFEKGVTIFEIAREYNTEPNTVLELLSDNPAMYKEGMDKEWDKLEDFME
jgi:hypothetical protein